MSDARALKIEAARRALGQVREGMLLGLGTGSTSEEFVRLLGEKTASGEISGIRAVCTSARTEELARSLGIGIIALEEAEWLDLAVDGADEVDPHLRLIKGRGAALLREKIVEQAARRFIVIVDESKIVERLGRGSLPVEVTRFAAPLLFKRFAEMKLEPSKRLAGDDWLLTDEKHYIIDVTIPPTIDISAVVENIREMAGVVETGFFPTEATEVIVAAAKGIRVMRRP